MTLITAVSLQKAIKNASHYKAIGETTIYLQDAPYPWELAVSCKPGGTHRITMYTDVRFKAKHPCGLIFDWNFSLEPISANGSDVYRIDVKGCRDILSKLPVSAAKDFRSCLERAKESVLTHAKKYQAAADSQYAIVAKLEEALSELTPAN